MTTRSTLACLAVVAACSSSGGGGGGGGDATTGGGDGDGGSHDGGGSNGGDGGHGSGHGRWVLGYYAGYQINDLPIADVDWSALSHIAIAPMVVNGDLSLDESFDDTNGTGIADAEALATAAHAHGVVPLLMLGGADAGGNIATAASAAHRAAFVASLLAELDKLGYDGIDLDWEDSVNLDDLVSLAQALRSARPSIVLTYPSGTINGNYQTADPRYATLAAALDQFNVQTYYPETAFTGAGWDSWFLAPVSGASGTTPIAIDDTFQRYTAIGVPAAKLGMGTAFYAICYTGGITGPRQATNGTSQTVVGGDNNYPLTAFYASGGTWDANAAARKRDATAEEPYLALGAAVNDSHCGMPTQYISYEDETSLAAKGAFAAAHGYGGVIVWTLAEGYLPANAAGGRTRDAIFDALGSAFLQ